MSWVFPHLKILNQRLAFGCGSLGEYINFHIMKRLCEPPTYETLAQNTGTICDYLHRETRALDPASNVRMTADRTS